MTNSEFQKNGNLADVPGFGRVFDCGGCGGIHVSVGAVTMTFSPEGFMQLVAMIHTSAAGFETWLQQRSCGPEN